MPQITITNNGPAATPVTSVYDQDVTIEANDGVGEVNLGNLANDSNVEQIMEVNVSNVVNATFTNVAIDNPATGGVDFFDTLPALMAVPAGAQMGVKITFAVDEPAPGQANPTATADYTAAWQ